MVSERLAVLHAYWMHVERRETRVTHVSGISRNPCVRNGPWQGGDPGRIRTCDLQLRRLLLYPLSYGAVGSLIEIPSTTDLRTDAVAS